MLPYVCRRFVSYRQGVILGAGGGAGGREGSFLVKSKCMARGLLKKKKCKKNLSRTFAMVAHIPQSHGDEITVEKKKKNGRVLPSSLQCHFSFNPRVFVFLLALYFRLLF